MSLYTYLSPLIISDTTDSSGLSSGSLQIAGGVGIGKNIFMGNATTNSSLVISGAEKYQPATGNATNAGIAITAGVNRANNRQLWIGDSASMTASASLYAFRLTLSGTGYPAIGGVTTDGLASCPLLVNSVLEMTNTINMQGANLINFGSNVSKETNAGKLGYKLFSTDALDILGAGPAGGGANRLVRIWDTLHVNGSGLPNFSPGGSGYYFNSGTSALVYSASYGTISNCSIRATDAVYASSFAAYSDERIKTNMIPVSHKYALDTIKEIVPKRFNYIDQVRKTSEVQMGFIAQNVEKCLPEGVSKSTDVIPNIVSFCSIEENNGAEVILISERQIPETVNAEDEIAIWNNTEEFRTKVLSVDGSKITVEGVDKLRDTEGKLFLYGTVVSDFLLVKETAILALTVAAVKGMLEKIVTLEERMDRIEKRLNNAI